jgi:heme/copper-type cytochrome/quinol oxidase subunit 1
MLSFVAWNQVIEMLLAKRFALLAIVLLGVALLEGGTPHQRIDVVIHSTYFVIAHIHVLYVQALVSGCFELIYFAADRWVVHPLKNSLGLAHFGLVAVGFILTALAMHAVGYAAVSPGLPTKIYVAIARVNGEAAPNLWPFFAFGLGAVSLLLGCAVFAVNLASTTVGVLRAH